MTFMHVLRNGHSGFCEADPPVFFIVDVAAFVQTLKHLCDTRRTYVKIVRDIHRRGVALVLYQLIDDFEVVLHAGGPAHFLHIVRIPYRLEAAAPCSPGRLGFRCFWFPSQSLLLQQVTAIDIIDTVKKSCNGMSVLLSVDRLRTMLGDENLLLVDARPFASYAESHIPGAVNIDLMQFHWIDTSKQGMSQFEKQGRILLSNIGVAPKKFVVFYDDISGSSAARGVWLLLYFSHNSVAMLDGGINAWKARRYETETKTNPFVHSNFRGKPDRRILADVVRVSTAAKSKKAIIVDARSQQEYDGSTVRAAKAGHIPGAINIDWNDNLQQDSFKDPEALQRIYAQIPKDAEVITYCQGGYRAANSFVVLKMLGYKNVRMYLGSWGEWGNKPELPVSRK